MIRRRLHAATRLLEARTRVLLLGDNLFRPDLALVTAATGRLWLAVEIVSSSDHRRTVCGAKRPLA
jgi:hypothetical protein